MSKEREIERERERESEGGREGGREGERERGREGERERVRDVQYLLRTTIELLPSVLDHLECRHVQWSTTQSC